VTKHSEANDEFRRLFERSGWTQAEAARQLDVTPGVVSQYLSGDTRPSGTTLKLLHVLVGDAALQLKAPLSRSGGDVRLKKAVAELQRDVGRSLRKFRAAVGVSSSADVEAEELLGAAEEVADREIEESRRKSQVAGPSAKRSGPSAGASTATREQPASPKRAPK